MVFNPNNRVTNGQEGIAMAEESGLDGRGFFSGLHGLVSGLWNDFRGTSAQQELQSNQQEFDEYMYNEYNSPEALTRQYKDAGMNLNLLGSTSFGTAQSAAGAPAVNGNGAPLQSLAQSAQALGTAASQFADPELKRSQTRLNVTQEDVNHALELMYGSEYNLNDIQYSLAKDTYQWSLENAEFTAKSAREGYYLACQAYTKGWQEYENLIKEGALLDEEVERTKWEKKIKEETFNILIEHGYMPDATYLDKIYTDFVYNGDNQSFDRFIRGYSAYSDCANRSSARFGAFGNTIKIGGVEVPMEYILQSGKDLVDIINDIKGDDNPSSIRSRIRRFFGMSDVDETSDPPKPTRGKAKHMNTYDAATAILYSNMEKPSRDEMCDYLIDECGYSAKWVREHILDVEEKVMELK